MPDKITDWLLVLFNGLLFGTSILLWLANRRSVKVAERALTELERPYIYIFDTEGLEIETNREEPYYYLTYSISNYGRTPASIEITSTKISVGEWPKSPIKVPEWHNFVRSPILTPNSRRDGTEEIVPDAIQIGEYADEDTPPTPAPVLKGDERFFFWIQIEYRGPFSSGHKTSACWQFDAQGARPTLYGGPKYNYQT